MPNETWAYRVEIFWSDEDDGYIAVVPDLPGCSSFGSDRREAATQIEDAMRCWIEAMEMAGNPVPCPTSPSPSVPNAARI
jgi:antitoxin HicB